MFPPELSSEATWPRFCEAGISRTGSGGLGAWLAGPPRTEFGGYGFYSFAKTVSRYGQTVSAMMI